MDTSVLIEQNENIYKQEQSSHKLLALCLRFGELLLLCGAETSRIEDSIVRILRAYEKKEASAFAIPTLLLVTFQDADGTLYSSSRRMGEVNKNFNRFEKLNQLSRALCTEKKSLAFFEKELNEIGKISGYGLPVQLLGAAGVAVGFAYVFSATITDIFIAGVLAVLARLVFYYLESVKLNSLFNQLLNSFLIAASAELLAKVGLVDTPSSVTVAVFMNLVPGMLITTSIYDLVRRDFTSGISRLSEAFFNAVMLAIGSGIAVYFLR